MNRESLRTVPEEIVVIIIIIISKTLSIVKVHLAKIISQFSR